MPAKISVYAAGSTFTPMRQKEVRICIVGAGPGGALAALFLAKSGIPSLVIDQATFPRDKICGDALSAKCADTLLKLDASFLEEFKQCSFQLASDGVNFIAPNLEALRLTFGGQKPDSKKVGGFIVKRMDFDNLLSQWLHREPLIEFIENCPAQQFEKTDSGWIIHTPDLQIHAALLIDGSGAHSSFSRHHAGIQKEDEHYSAGLRVYYKGVTGMDPDNYIELHFLKELLPGYFWIFPLPNGEANVGIGIRSDVVSERKLNLKKLLTQLIEEHPVISKRFKEATPIDAIRGYGLPLGSKRRKLSGPNYLLLGDAAALIDPFTGEGIGNAMISGMKAAELIKTLDSKASNFHEEDLKPYDAMIYRRLGKEFAISTRFLQLVRYPWLFNFIVRKANRNPMLRETMSSMFESVDLRRKLKNPIFYLRLLFNL